MSAEQEPFDADALEGLSLIEAALHAEPDAQRESDSLLERGEIPAEFDGLQLKQLLGRGGMGEVYLARQVALERHVAVKVRVAPSCAGIDVDELLGREARTLAALEHPGIVRVLDTGSVAGRRYLVMEQVRGRTLREWLERRPHGLSPAAALIIARGIAEALAAAHAAGVVHRDLKPSNVLVGRATGAASRVRLVDFGIAGRAFNESDPSELGTWEAMAPEQRAGLPVGPPADVYALGLMLSAMVGGRPDVPGSLQRLITHFSAVDPARRPCDGTAAAEELDDWSQRLNARLRRTPWRWTAAALAVILFVTALSFWLSETPAEPELQAPDAASRRADRRVGPPAARPDGFRPSTGRRSPRDAGLPLRAERERAARGARDLDSIRPPRFSGPDDPRLRGRLGVTPRSSEDITLPSDDG